MMAACGIVDLAAERGYIQSYWGTASIPEKHAKRIIGCANKILRAGFGLGEVVQQA